MESADMIEVFKRLGEQVKSLFDERHQEMPLKENHWGEEPLFLRGER